MDKQTQEIEKKELKQLTEQANLLTIKTFGNKVWYGRCIFLSWYCDVGTCKFCYRSTQKARIKHATHAKRSIGSILVEALLAKNLGWRIEFLTGGYKSFPMEELIEIARLVEKVYEEKIWLNLGALSKEDLDQFRPHIKGIVSSIETIAPELHGKICPDKPIEPYEEMFNNANDLKKSITIVIGLGEKRDDFALLQKFIEKWKLDRITFYALKPVPGTPYEKGPETEEYLWWIAKTRLAFPKLQIIAGTTLRRYKEVGQILKAGANAFTKFPITKKFNSEEAIYIENDIKQAGRELKGTLTQLPDIDWNKEVDDLDINDDLKKEVKEKLILYLKRMQKHI
tara:strand:- start:12993 stop:14012 length:1020 start_codon:yes stop_codon:yes gene_type:complete